MGSSFRLMTSNLLHERCDAADFARVLQTLDPDVIVTQELGPQCAEVISGVYPHHDLKPAPGFMGRGIATRFDAVFGRIDMAGRPGSSALLDIDGTTVRMAGVHLLNPIQFPWWRQARERGGQLDRLFQWVDSDGDHPVVCAGDFNASPLWPAYRRTAGRLTDLVADLAAARGSSPERTWAWRPGWPRMLRIDHIFGRGVRATDVVVQPILGSDHYAVVADLEIQDDDRTTRHGARSGDETNNSGGVIG